MKKEPNKVVPEGLDDKEAAFVEVEEKHGSHLKFLSKRLKADPEIVFAAVESDGTALQFADEKLKADRAIVLAAVKSSRGKALQYADEKLRSDREIVLSAIAEDAWSLKYATHELRSDQEIVTTAFNEFNNSLPDSPEMQKFFKELVPNELLPQLVIGFLKNNSIEESLSFLEECVPEDVLIQDEVFQIAEKLVIDKYIQDDLLPGYDVRPSEVARAIDEEVEYLETCDLRMFMVFSWDKYGDYWETERIVPRFIYSALKRREKK